MSRVPDGTEYPDLVVQVRVKAGGAVEVSTQNPMPPPQARAVLRGAGTRGVRAAGRAKPHNPAASGA